MLRTHALPAKAPNVAVLALRLIDTLLLWHERSRQRRQLAGLDSRLLSDIGISRSQAVAEASKPFWRT